MCISQPLVPKKRCAWVNTNYPDYIQYHDQEWGVPVHEDTKHFELLSLEGAQAGLSWLTILKKRAGYRKAFRDFAIKSVAKFTNDDLEQLYIDSNIVPNRLKIQSVINNAQKMLEVQKKWGSFDAYIWHYVNKQPVINAWKSLREVPTKTPLSDQVSKDLKKQGFTFIGSTTIYAYLQSAGIVNDHTVDCFRYHDAPRRYAQSLSC